MCTIICNVKGYLLFKSKHINYGVYKNNSSPTALGGLADMRKVEILPQTDFWGFKISSK